MSDKPKRPIDANQLAKRIVDLATGQADDDRQKKKDPDQVERGRMGGKVGGKARAEKMTPQERSEAARKAAKARWG